LHQDYLIVVVVIRSRWWRAFARQKQRRQIDYYQVATVAFRQPSDAGWNSKLSWMQGK
jgi:hypothetical protein